MREPTSPRRPDVLPASNPRRSLPACSARALALWPRLDHARLARTGGDPMRIARLVMARTSLGADQVVALLTREGSLAS
jgi:hypothetical protein